LCETEPNYIVDLIVEEGEGRAVFHSKLVKASDSECKRRAEFLNLDSAHVVFLIVFLCII